MKNPTYLSLSRHNIYYFRYPIPKVYRRKYAATHIKISLETREPKEALRLARYLEYYAHTMSQNQILDSMSYDEVVSILREKFSSSLEKIKTKIHEKGPHSPEQITSIQEALREVEEAIECGENEVCPLYVELYPEQSVQHRINKILDDANISLDKESKEYNILINEYKYAYRNHLKDMLAYNEQVREYSNLQSSNLSKTNPSQSASRITLEDVIKKYITDKKRGNEWGGRASQEKIDQFNYLTELLGKEFNFCAIDSAKARYVKETLIETPTNRNKLAATRNKTILQQIKVKGLQKLSNGSVNKYLQCYSGLCKWGVSNGYLNSNPFETMRLNDKKRGKRDAFSDDEVIKMLTEILDKKIGLVKTETQYWSSLLYIYTGARLNEIASLLPSDIKHDLETNIWYIDITDEKEQGKTVKTDAAIRTVPIHSKLIELGFLDFVEQSQKKSKALIKKSPKKTLKPRLFYDLKYNANSGWGRRVADWFNNRFLTTLGLKIRTRKTLHSLRHSFITKLSIAGVQTSYIKSLVGHEGNTVTEQTYTHYGLKHLPTLKDAIEKVIY